MAKQESAWGIDIGNASLKALRLRPTETPNIVQADAFDYIEYPMLLTQPAADPPSLIETALKQFLSRNEVRGHKVAISVSGATGLARFIRLPPVELSKLVDVVRFEAKQQIPYDLDSVVWRYQRMDVGSEESSFALGSTIGLFALKRDQIDAALEPFRKLGIEVDVIQLSPLALFNYARFDAMDDLPPPDDYDPDNPPPSLCIFSMGTDSSDLVITNGYRVWQRNIPLGGNHFTKALSKELKLTFSKAEHLKRNPTSHPDSKAVFQAMRPVFSELLSELQRSISYYGSIERSAEISRGIALGNPMKLPGLRGYIEKGLGFPIERVDSFPHMVGNEVVEAAGFRENLSCFGVVYGLALQGIDRAYMKINMLPDEVVKDRFIRAKKPWALAAAATLLLGCTVSFAASSLALSSVSPNRFGSAEQRAKQVVDTAKRHQQDLASVESEFDRIKAIGENLTGNVEGRLLWLELLTAVNQALPQYRLQAQAVAAQAAAETDAAATEDPKQQAEALESREEIHITSLDANRWEDLSLWWQQTGGWYKVPEGEEGAEGSAGSTPAQPAAPAAVAPAAPAMGGAGSSPYGASSPYGTSSPYGGSESMYPGASPYGAAVAPPPPSIPGPTGAGYVIRLTGYHYHNSDKARTNQGAEYVRNTLIKNLETGPFFVNGEWLTPQELGIGFPCLINPGRTYPVRVMDPNLRPSASATGTGTTGPTGIPSGSLIAGGTTGALGTGAPGAPGTLTIPGVIELKRFDFVIEFVWQPKTESERKLAREEAQKQAAEAAAQAATGAQATGEASGSPAGAGAAGVP
ncbi:MAG: type IV pilus assembly protein PilM, partial [Thermogutta sp.]|nr:type IV pilus assembly protein PilM [Thermogutta sp.]